MFCNVKICSATFIKFQTIYLIQWTIWPGTVLCQAEFCAKEAKRGGKCSKKMVRKKGYY